MEIPLESAIFCVYSEKNFFIEMHLIAYSLSFQFN